MNEKIVIDVVKKMNKSNTILIDDNLCFPVVLCDELKVMFFHDFGTLDYIDRIYFPNGEEWDYDDMPDYIKYMKFLSEDEKLNLIILILGFVDYPVSDLEN